MRARGTHHKFVGLHELTSWVVYPNALSASIRPPRNVQAMRTEERWGGTRMSPQISVVSKRAIRCAGRHEPTGRGNVPSAASDGYPRQEITGIRLVKTC